MSRHVKSYKVVLRVFRGWFSLLIALALLAGFWYGCYWLVREYAGAYTPYFKYGAITAVAIGLVMLVFNEPIVKWSMGCERVRCREDSPRLWDAVRKVTPWHARPLRIYLCPEGGMNAFSFGWGLPGFSAVAATRGAVENLSQEELEAVMAHEVGHIINKDILVSMAMAISVMMIAMTGWMLMRCGPYSGGRRSSGDSKNGAIALLVILLVGCIMYLFGRLLGVILQMFVSRQREYAADALSAELVGSPKPLASALGKIVRGPGMYSETKGLAFGFLCTADPEPDDMLATHPDPANRIRALEALER